MKVLVLVVVCLILISGYVQSAAVLRSGLFPHNLIECDPSIPGVKVLQKVIQKPGRAQTIITDALQYPRSPGMSSSAGIVSCITVEDLSRNGKGGYADIVSGGLGYNFVTISFESQKGEDIQFSVIIHAYYPRSPGNPLFTKENIGHETIEP